MSFPAGARLSVARAPWTTDENPYQLAVYAALAAHGIDLVGTADLSEEWPTDPAPDVLHIQWRLDRLARRAPQGEDPATWVCDRLDQVRRTGTTLAWTVHEPGALLDPADPYRSSVERHLLTHADVALVHDEPTARLVTALARPLRTRELPVATTPLGDYRPFVESIPLDAEALDDARDRLGVGAHQRLVLAQGALRADKDLPLLVAAFDRLGRDDVVLAVAGRIADATSSATLRSLGRRNVRILPRHLPSADVAAHYAVADLAVLARRVDWTPSSLLFAVAHDTPVVAPDLPTNRAAIGDRGATWATPGDPLALAAALRRALDDPTAAAATLRAAQRHVADRSWGRSARIAARALSAAVADRRATAPDPEPATTGP